MQYPRCATTFRKWLSYNQKYIEIYNKLSQPKPFDVTLRDGIQGLKKEQIEEMTTENKIRIYNDIIRIYQPKNIEIGSIVSEKLLPVFKDTQKIFELIENNNNNIIQQNNYILVSNQKNLFKIINKTDNIINNFSFITSVSNSFQKKNTKMSLEESDQDIINMIQTINLDTNRCQEANIKLYVSCINECPIEGKIDNDFIVNRLLNLNKLNIHKLCLSDTCGTLDIDDFEYIVDTCAFFGIQMSKFSLHLHVKPNRENIIEQIIHKALERKITEFDVSALETGGCSVTIKNNELTPNLSYDLYYKSLVDYIKKFE